MTSDAIPLSYISQYGYCARRAGLMLLEQAWSENEHTASGRAGHRRVHDARVERSGDLIKLYELHVESNELGLCGKCDCVEARRGEGDARLPFEDGEFQLYPVEYKNGVVRDEREYQMQLCAQAICLEERYGGVIERGALYFINAHRRSEIPLDDALRAEVRAAARALRDMLASLAVPRASYSSKCVKCSLRELCQPRAPVRGQAYRLALMRQMEENE